MLCFASFWVQKTLLAAAMCLRTASRISEGMWMGGFPNSKVAEKKIESLR